MAKKKFDIKSTIAVQPKTFSVDDVESAVQKIHEAKTVAEEKKVEKAKPPILAKPKPRPKKAADKAPKSPSRRGRPRSPEAPIKKVRLSIDVDPATHKRLKIRAIEQDSDIMHYVEMLIEKDLAKG